MRDAFGGLVNIAIIVVFMTIVSGYLAFNVSYTKAFKVNNKIISVYEEYDGCDGVFEAKCENEIDAYIQGLGYNAKEPDLTSDTDIIVRVLKQPNCSHVDIKDGVITFDIEKELGVEIVGDTKVKIAIEDDEEPWDVIEDDYTEEVDQEINNVEEKYL